MQIANDSLRACISFSACFSIPWRPRHNFCEQAAICPARCFGQQSLVNPLESMAPVHAIVSSSLAFGRFNLMPYSSAERQTTFKQFIPLLLKH
eukprot:549450-Pleurochrysis_carterae.AAC.2